MANQDIGVVFDNLARQMAGLTTAVGAQGIAQMVPSFDGTPSKYKNWIRDIEKYGYLINIARDKLKLVAFQTSTGSVSSFLQRFLGDHEDITWEQLKAELSARFAEITDSQHAFSLLRTIKQKQGESCQMFVERMLGLAEIAYDNQPGGLETMEKQLIGLFTDGILDNAIKLRIMRENPNTLQAACLIASKEQNLRKRFDLRFGKQSKFEHNAESMEIDYSRPSQNCFNCKRPGHVSRDCRKPRYVSRRSINAINRQNTFLCWNCHQAGHVRRHCKNPSISKRKFRNQEN